MSKLKDVIKGKLAGFKFKLGKRSQMAIAGVLALIMLIIFFKGIGSSTASTEKESESIETSSTPSSDYIENLENRLVNIISSIKGIGTVKAFVMTETSVESIYATNDDSKASSDGENISTTKEIVFSKDGSTTTPVLRLEIYPEITGVLIVAEGADDEKLRLMVINAISVALDIENSKIEVLSGKS